MSPLESLERFGRGPGAEIRDGRISRAQKTLSGRHCSGGGRRPLNSHAAVLHLKDGLVTGNENGRRGGEFSSREGGCWWGSE